MASREDDESRPPSWSGPCQGHWRLALRETDAGVHSSIAIALPLERAHDGVDGIDIGPREVVLAFDHEGHGQCLAGDAAYLRCSAVSRN